MPTIEHPDVWVVFGTYPVTEGVPVIVALTKDEAIQRRSGPYVHYVPVNRIDDAYEALQGRLGRDDATKAETVRHACEEYVLVEDELTDECDSEDYSLSRGVRHLRGMVDETKALLLVAGGMNELLRIVYEAAQAFTKSQVKNLGDHASERTEEENALHQAVTLVDRAMAAVKKDAVDVLQGTVLQGA